MKLEKHFSRHQIVFNSKFVFPRFFAHYLEILWLGIRHEIQMPLKSLKFYSSLIEASNQKFLAFLNWILEHEKLFQIKLHSVNNFLSKIQLRFKVIQFNFIEIMLLFDDITSEFIIIQCNNNKKKKVETSSYRYFLPVNINSIHFHFQ